MQCGFGPCSGGILRRSLLKHQRPACFIQPASPALTFFKLYCLCIAIHAWHKLPINPLQTENHPSLRVGADFAFTRQSAGYLQSLCPHQARAQLTTLIIFQNGRCPLSVWREQKKKRHKNVFSLFAWHQVSSVRSSGCFFYYTAIKTPQLVT